ncbi:bifunctional [glutamine synthetase] adenylyltransferase/[glutamine synthetase]-adenylyl-L-tyrosine phosphorylase [Homoserinimonas sp. OAct 916]|uniref:bifunctional [glutamine synthetase] adenylyltransferase/[glutamine synthetase]-adenylyl-L-tyrosine phosphorylase n=1 Tax=Homoserinimonas sp. OAct 916 TaxID=2211450 RepID=UPI000DBE6685|nr:bifunctional [glutamine synthetase] adenylyltransferase/[glutamine synthetase]-adenylyl-L-tyrosine phosphorylase [Homoserinimonas sp. OAct 916]
MTGSSPTLTEIARAGFSDLGRGAADLAAAQQELALPTDWLLHLLGLTADPDQAVAALIQLNRRSPDQFQRILRIDGAVERLAQVAGASSGLVDFFLRHPDQLDVLTRPLEGLPTREELAARLRPDAIGQAHDLETSWDLLRVRYRAELARLAAWDLEAADPVEVIGEVTGVLSDLAGAALDAALAIARDHLCAGPSRFSAEAVQTTRLAIIGMGKAGARELNYVSDVDVLFVASSDPEAPEHHLDIATKLAQLTMRGLAQDGAEPALWEVDANLRPEGKDGALVRTFDSFGAYYDRWADSWEFQALLKARPLAGDLELGASFVEAVSPRVWESAGRPNFVESVQGMRQRVTDSIPDDEAQLQLKLGVGGLRDVEFTVQLLQLVHGRADPEIRVAGTLEALEALAAHGYIGRAEAVEFARDYRVLRLLEHRLQLQKLRRTHLMPADAAGRRILARASGLAGTADEITRVWTDVQRRVRGLHQRLFYRPLLAAVAALDDGEQVLTSDQAASRLAAIGFRDPAGALGHMVALTNGVSRRADIQRLLLPVLLQWFAEGADPDYGLLAFRRLSDALGTTHWYLRMLRDSSGAAQRLTRVLSGSRFVGELLERIPEATAWLEDQAELVPRPLEPLRVEAGAILARHTGAEAAARALRAVRRRELLRLALSSILGVCTADELGRALSDVNTFLIEGVLAACRREQAGGGAAIEFAVIAMGRYGGAELGFGSDADVLYVYRAESNDGGSGEAGKLVSQLKKLTEDTVLPFDLDSDLRPEGRNGPVARSLASYRSYYERWSLTWEAQALLRARGVAGDAGLIADFEAVADRVRYPTEITDVQVREVKRIKARVENERLPHGVDRRRHLKLGTGSLSDVEWFVQLIQLQHAASIPELRTTSTLVALNIARAHDLVTESDARKLRSAWLLSTRIRSAITLWTNKTSDVLPTDWQQLDGIARLCGYAPGQAAVLEEDYLAATRRARVVFERHFYPTLKKPPPSTG